ncbi:alpha/beta hydrolase [Schaalia sp. lx-100]|uniref:alpha/beta hydrolase n=1 Tax=Schaalia sp. lx-100 TaxID=2899081 RepID=UPI001E624EF4|nr:alpha/beta hydrolase [Schaalia sp. lx-100]MCD4556649.1 alpha/beta fold hydrolase [Schaalia sp. lx-100]
MPHPRLSRIVSGNPQRGTMIAMHGVTDNAASLSDFAQHYSTEWEVICLDSLGHGLSPAFTSDELTSPFESLYRAALTEVAAAAREADGTVVLYGHSLGGAIAATIAHRHSELVSALILEDPALLTDEQSELYASSANELAARQDLVSAHVGEAIVGLMENYPSWPPSEYGAWAQGKVQVDRDFVRTGVVGTPRAHILNELNVPTLLVTGDADDVLFGAEGLSKVQEAHNPFIHCVFLPGTTHTVRRDAPATFYERADDFLASLNLPERRPPFIVNELAHVPGATPPQTTWDVPALRKRGDDLLGEELPEVEGITRESVTYKNVPMQVHRPEGPVRAAVLSIHGGGFIAGRARFDDTRNGELSHAIGSALVVSPDYRLAPEHPFPAGVEDCLIAWEYLEKEAPGVPVILYGDSAGAGLVSQCITALARKRAGGPATDASQSIERRLDAVISIEPCIDPQMTSHSYRTCKEGPLWTAEAAKHAWAHYLGTAHPYEVHSSVNLIADFMAPTFVVVNPTDPLRDEGIAWATDLADAGVAVEMHMLMGTIHGTPATLGSQTWAHLCSLISHFLTTNVAGLGE